MKHLLLKIKFRLMRFVSLLPDRLLIAISKRWPWRDPAEFGWNFWMDASYWKWCRIDKRRNPGCE